MAESEALPTVISASWKYVWKKSNVVIQVKHIMSIEMFAILERHICKRIIVLFSFETSIIKKNSSTKTIYPKKAQV